MEATKKKKAYLKPEMTKFEMGTEGTFMEASRAPMDTPILIECFDISNNSWPNGGSWSEISNVVNGGTVSTQIKPQTDLLKHAPKLYNAGFREGDCIIAERTDKCTENSDDKVSILVTRINCNQTIEVF